MHRSADRSSTCRAFANCVALRCVGSSSPRRRPAASAPPPETRSAGCKHHLIRYAGSSNAARAGNSPCHRRQRFQPPTQPIQCPASTGTCGCRRSRRPAWPGSSSPRYSKSKNRSRSSAPAAHCGTRNPTVTRTRSRASVAARSLACRASIVRRTASHAGPQFVVTNQPPRRPPPRRAPRCADGDPALHNRQVFAQLKQASEATGRLTARVPPGERSVRTRTRSPRPRGAP